MTELTRLLRHGFAPLTAWMVMNGWLPESMQGDVTEFLVIGTSIAIPYLFSWLRDKKGKE